MIRQQGLGHFYDLRQGISQPASAPSLPPDAFGWLPPLAEQAEAEARASGAATASLTLPIEGIHCIGCRWLIGELFARQREGVACETDPAARLIHFSWHLPPQAAPVAHNALQTGAETGTIDSLPLSPDTPAPVAAGRFDPLSLAETLFAFGYTLENPALPRRASVARNSTGAPEAGARKRLATRLLLCGVFAVNAIIFSLPVRLGASDGDFPLLRLFGLLVFLCATLCVGLAASYFFQVPPASGTGGTPLRDKNNKSVIRRCIGVLLLVVYVASLAGQSLGLPILFAPDAVAALSFVALLAAFATNK